MKTGQQARAFPAAAIQIFQSTGRQEADLAVKDKTIPEHWKITPGFLQKSGGS